MKHRAIWLNVVALLLAGCKAPLTYTALDLTPFGPLLYAITSAVNIFYWVCAIALMWLAVRRPATPSRKFGAAILVVIIFGYLPVTDGLRIYQARVHHEKTFAMFTDRCNRSGEKIKRTVENVEGFMVLKLRPTNYSPYDQNAIDPYGYDFDWESKGKPPPYLQTFLIGKDEKGRFTELGKVAKPGYRYVETVDPGDGKRYRYTGSVKVVSQADRNAPNVRRRLEVNPNYDVNHYAYVVDKAPASGSKPKFGVTYEDISTAEERAHWIAGSSLKVIDLETNEVIAERVGYMVDFAQGATPGGRQPWTFAQHNNGWSCPALNGQSYRARRFVEKVLLISDSQAGSQQDAAR